MIVGGVKDPRPGEQEVRVKWRINVEPRLKTSSITIWMKRESQTEKRSRETEIASYYRVYLSF